MPEQISAATPAGRSRALDGLRGWAAVLVVFFHAMFAMGDKAFKGMLYPEIWRLTNAGESAKAVIFILNGQTAVSLFFLLSGAVLFRSLRREKLRPITFVTFPLQRAFRIYPGLATAMILAWVVAWIMGANWPSTFVAHPLTVLFTDIALFTTRLVGLTYTLQAEMLAVPFFLAAALLLAWNRYLGSIVVIAFGIGLTIYPLPFVPSFFSVLLIFFAMGIFVTGRAGEVAARWLAPVWPLLLLGFVFYRAFVPYWAWYALFGQALFGFALLSVAYHRRTSLNPLLESAVSQFLGRISYSLYLVNAPFLFILLKLVAPQPALTDHPLLTGGTVAIVVLAVAIPLAWLNERYVERPGIRLGHWVRDRLTRTTPAGAAAVPAAAPGG